MLSHVRNFLVARTRTKRSAFAGIDKALATLVTLAPETLATTRPVAREVTPA